MPSVAPQWQVRSPVELPAPFLHSVQSYAAGDTGAKVAQVLWQRGIREPEQLLGFLDWHLYRPTSPAAFGAEMVAAVARILQARTANETIAIWGDFDADGVTATAVLWDGLGQFFTPQKTLRYYIPNRLTESHGLSEFGLRRLHHQGCRLIITCDTGSTNLAEITLAQTMGMDVIVTDHHTLPPDRPPVVAIINPRYLEVTHPLATLSGVAVAYKLVEAVYEALPEIPQKPLEQLLDLVAIGLIADLVDLRGDCRYLAQRGIEQLQQQSQASTVTRPGIAKLLEFCKLSGNRPTDISFGLGPRINAVSRIQGEADFCIELLTSQDKLLCSHLAEATELANTRRKALQNEVMQEVNRAIGQLDLSTTSVIVLADPNWAPGVLGLVAGQVAQDYGRPTILLAIEGKIARGSARSVNQIDLYQLVKSQQHLLDRFGGHPFAAGLSLPLDNLPLFTAAINQELRQLLAELPPPMLAADLTVTVADLSKDLFQALKLLEPCGMGNPVPKLLIRNVWFDKVWNENIKDRRGQKVKYIKTEFELWDDTCEQGFPGLWWGHYRDELPSDRCDVMVELDSNNFKRRYEVRLLAVRPHEPEMVVSPAHLPVIDWRSLAPEPFSPAAAQPLTLTHCPTNWTELLAQFRQARQEQRPLAIAYPPPTHSPALKIWQNLVGIAKYLSRTGESATPQQMCEKLGIGDRTLDLGVQTLPALGFDVRTENQVWIFAYQPGPPDRALLAERLQRFESAVQEEQFRRDYFYQVSIGTITATTARLPVNDSLQEILSNPAN